MKKQRELKISEIEENDGELKDKYYQQPHVGFCRDLWRESKLNDAPRCGEYTIQLVWSGYIAFLKLSESNSMILDEDRICGTKVGILFALMQLNRRVFIGNTTSALGLMHMH